MKWFWKIMVATIKILFLILFKICILGFQCAKIQKVD
jgi:hypothetical protein